MRRCIDAFLIGLLLLGCNRQVEPTAKFFSGKPVEYWLEAIKSADAKARQKAADVLGNVGPIDSRAIPALIEALKDKDPKVRDAAVLSLSRIGAPASVALPALEEAAKDKDPSVCSHATAAVARIRAGQ